MQIFRETENLYRLTRFGMVNCFLVKEKEGLTLIDTNLPGSAQLILAAAEKLHSPIQRILLTHAHFDHVGSVESLVTALPDIEFLAGSREARLLSGDFSLDAGESGKKLFGFKRVRTRPHRLLAEGEQVGSLHVVDSPGHTPGHISLLDVRDNSLIAGDAFTTQTGLVAAGVFSLTFPFPALFSWNPELSARSAGKLRALMPSQLAVGHGRTLVSPLDEMDRAIEEAFRQHPGAARG